MHLPLHFVAYSDEQRLLNAENRLRILDQNAQNQSRRSRLRSTSNFSKRVELNTTILNLKTDLVENRTTFEMVYDVIQCDTCMKQLAKVTSHIHRCSNNDEAMEFLRSYENGFWFNNNRSKFGTTMCAFALGVVPFGGVEKF